MRIRVQPRASRDHVEAQPDGSLKVWTTAAPTDGQANERVLRLLAEHLGVSPSRLTLVRGHRSRDKEVDVVQPT